MTGGSAKLANVRAGAVRSEIRAKMELRSQQKKSKKYGQATAGRAAGAHKSTATRIRKIIRRVNNNSDQLRFAFLKQNQNVYRKAQK
jgi:carbon monoxide dehydrogenase subunit G